MKYVYPAVMYLEGAMNDKLRVVFPDVQNAMAAGDDYDEAVCNASRVLSLALMQWEDAKAAGKRSRRRIDPPTPLMRVVSNVCNDAQFSGVVLVKADTDVYRREYQKRQKRRERFKG